ncbi:hypothetical protein E4631_11585 [Hymenobacter sp. UV11]|uniref:CdiA C-terminal domain-containing protein n=1 Tax=Hymenobacter sp. UV11 TaxID=1849735 RepID=UPI001061CB45|nr:hypothetical protein [Hymenobacter sp. UV11]TDN40353.1 hypothetical protein A8B98_12970 [Hymenobacter sp. UV11]TFZ66645.1 hypothetical protein E4631_11585 [Hymenobacter sp. UV11]
MDIHENHGKQESRGNLPIALFLAQQGECVCLLGIVDKPNVKSPDATRNGVIWEFKIPQGRTENAIDKALRDGSRQASHILLQLPADFNRNFLEGGIYNRTQRTEAIAEVAVLMDEDLYTFGREMIITNAFRGVIP